MDVSAMQIIVDIWRATEKMMFIIHNWIVDSNG